MEDRVGRLEVHVENIRSDISDMKIDIRRLNDKMDGVDQRLTAKIDDLDEKLTTKIDDLDEKLTAKIDTVDQKQTARSDGLKDSIASLALNMEKGFAELKVGRALDHVWWFMMSGALLGIMARAFKWI